MLGFTSSGVSRVKVDGGIDRVEESSVRVHLLWREPREGEHADLAHHVRPVEGRARLCSGLGLGVGLGLGLGSG